MNEYERAVIKAAQNLMSLYKVRNDTIDKLLEGLLPFIDKSSNEQTNRLVDLNKQGLLLELPCRIGSTVYILCPATGNNNGCPECLYANNGCEGNLSEPYDHVTILYNRQLVWIVRYLSDFNRRIFLSQEEADAALKKSQQEA